MPPKPLKPGPATYNQAASSPDQLLQTLSQLQLQLQDASAHLKSSAVFMDTLKQENLQLRSELTQVKVALNRQASYLAQLDSEVDNLGQYGRRENIVFSNLCVDEGQDVKGQIIELCKEVEVEVKDSDFVDAHVLPGRPGTPKRYIARFHDRSKVKQIFRNRRKTKGITAARKSVLAANDKRGFGIQANLTAKRAKLLAQVNNFCKERDNMSCWVDYNSGNVVLRIADGRRGTVISNTRNLVDIDNSFVPTEWYFCSAPYFEISQSELDSSNMSPEMPPSSMSPALPPFNPGVPHVDPYSCSSGYGYDHGKPNYNLRSAQSYKPY